MSQEQVSDIEVIDDINQSEDTVVLDESQSDSDVTSKEDEEDNTASTKPKKSNKSNWKGLTKKLKDKDQLISDLRKELSEYKGDDEDEVDDDILEQDESFDEVKFTRFLLKNPEAVNLENDIVDTLERFQGISFEEAFDFVKSNKSTSKTHTDFSTKTKSVPKKLSQLSEAEAMKHFKGDDAGYLEWQRQTGKIKY